MDTSININSSLPKISQLGRRSCDSVPFYGLLNPLALIARIDCSPVSWISRLRFGAPPTAQGCLLYTPPEPACCRHGELIHERAARSIRGQASPGIVRCGWAHVALRAFPLSQPD